MDTQRQFIEGNARMLANQPAAAAECYRQAAEHGLAGAQLYLGLCYAHGSGVAQDHEQAFGWVKRAAEQGEQEAQVYLGTLCAEGRGTRRDLGEAARWFEAAARAGCREAQFKLAQAFDL